MATTQRRTSIRKTLAVCAFAVSAALLGVSSPVASAAPATIPVTALPTLDTPEAWAAVKANALAGYPVSDKLSASCGAKQ